MPPRLILCIEYAAHLYQSRRLDHGILEAAIGKFLAYDLIADTEMALVLFGQLHATRNPFKRLDLSTDSRLTLYNPPIDPFDEPARYYTEQELLNLDIRPLNSNGQAGGGEQKLLVKGSCSFAKAISEAFNLQQQRSQYDDVGVDIVMVTSGLFVEDEPKLEEIIKNYYQRLDSAQLNIIIYPSSALFETKARDGSVILSEQESDIIVKSRVSKLLLIQRLTGAKVHLIKEHLDTNGDVKMSTLVQFYQIFEHIARGHSWDQTHSMALLGQQTVETTSRQQVSSNSKHLSLSFQFDVDSSIQNELIVAFIDPRQHQPRSSGKRFSIRQLQLRSPGGSLVLADHLPSSNQAASASAGASQSSGAESAGSASWPLTSDDLSSFPSNELTSNGSQYSPSDHLSPEAALFPYRSQLGLAGFHLKASHLNGTRSLSGKWTLSAISDEPLQTSALAMARVNPTGDTVTAHCWIQTYHAPTSESGSSSSSLKQVKVFARTQSGARMGVAQEVQARMEVQDELGNIVQNVQMLDDGLGAPDMTRGDGIHSQLINQRASRTGYYKVMVEMSGDSNGEQQDDLSRSNGRATTPGGGALGQDSACCGSYVPQQTQQSHDTRYLSRQLYCGTFFADATNRLGQQRPPRISNLTVANVDQDNRRVTLRWFEPQLDISVGNPLARRDASANDGELATDSHENSPLQPEVVNSMGEQLALSAPANSRSRQQSRSFAAEAEAEEERRDIDLVFDSININQAAQQLGQRSSNSIRALVLNGKTVTPNSAAGEPAQARYEIKMFTDRDSLKRAFDAKQEVGFRFNQWNTEGAFPNATLFGGQKEVTLRIPNGREGIYYIALKVYNSAGFGSHLSPIVSFWIRNNLTLEEAQSIYGNSMTSVDAEGNVYDKNGELVGNQLNYSLLRGTNSLDGISILVFICVLAFILSIVCISLVACLASSARKSFGKHQRKHHHDDDKKAAQSAIIGSQTGSGSSMVSGCGSSQQSEVASSVSGSSQVDGGGHDVELSNKHCGELAINDHQINATDHLRQQTINYNHLQQQQHYQQQQAQLIQAQHKLLSTNQLRGISNNNNNGNHFEDQQKYEQQQYSDAIYQRQMLNQSVLTTSHEFNNNKQQNINHWPPQSAPTTSSNVIMPQHTMINGYAYATVNHLLNSDGLSSSVSPAEAAAGGNLNQNGLGDAMSPVQSWPAELLISHYDKVKQARERNEAPPVMRIETLETPNVFTDGLPAINTNDELRNQYNQDQSYLVRQQRNQMPSYFNQQLQQQLSSVLRNKQRGSAHLDAADDIGKSSPALDGVTDHLSLELDQSAANSNNNNYLALESHQLNQIQPPPQYVYSADGVTSQQQALIAEPSIYSQVTNLQQVSSAEMMGGYYANQWQSGAAGGAVSNQAAATYSNQQQQQQQPHYQPEDYAQALDKCNSAISEV